MNRYKPTLLLGCLLIFAGTGAAESRPVAVSGAGCPSAGISCLQEVLDAIYGAGQVLVSQQLEAGYFAAIPPIAPTSSLTMTFEFAAFAASNAFGIYQVNNALNRVEVFPGSATFGDTATLNFVTMMVNRVIGGVATASPIPASISPFAFGFYLLGPGTGGAPSGVFTSQDAYNSSALAQMLSYIGPASSLAPGEITLSWEDLNRAVGSDSDFEDMVIIAQSLRPIPEPGTLALLGTCFVGLGVLLRRSLRKT